MDDNKQWKMKTLVIGGIVGALIGLGAAYVLIQRAEDEEVKPKLTAGEGVQLGLGVLGLLRLISNSGK
jgi:hypothetical protein